MANLEDGLSVFTNWQTPALGLTIYVMTAAIRRVVETGWVGAKSNKWWTDVFLPLGPIGNGILLAVFMKKFPWPAEVAESTSSRVIYALVCGLFCGWLYGRIRVFMKNGQKADPGGLPSLDVVIPAVDAAPSAEAAGEAAKPEEKG